MERLEKGKERESAPQEVGGWTDKREGYQKVERALWAVGKAQRGEGQRTEVEEEEEEGEEEAKAGKRPTASLGLPALPGEEPQTGSEGEPTAAPEPGSGQACAADAPCDAWDPQAPTVLRRPAESKTKLLLPE